MMHDAICDDVICDDVMLGLRLEEPYFRSFYVKLLLPTSSMSALEHFSLIAVVPLLTGQRVVLEVSGISVSITLKHAICIY